MYIGWVIRLYRFNSILMLLSSYSFDKFNIDIIRSIVLMSYYYALVICLYI